MAPFAKSVSYGTSVTRKSLFEFQTLFGRPLNNESEAAWNALMPSTAPESHSLQMLTHRYRSVGRGFVIIKNDTALPDQPGLNQSIVEQKAMVSVFHQLHCIVSHTTYPGPIIR